MSTEELTALRRQLTKARDHLHTQAVVLFDGRELLARESTWPRPRQKVEEQVEQALRFDVPMLLEEIVRVERRIAEIERKIAAAETPAAVDAQAQAAG